MRQFGGMTAVDVDHLEVERGLITALLGPNGAGKTTFFNLITGFDRPTSAASMFHRPDNPAAWSFEGKKMDRTSASSASRAGMVRTFQLTKALSRMTVMDNMMLGARGQTGEKLLTAMFQPTWSGQEKANAERARDLLARFKLDAKKDDYAGSLSGGQRKLLEMARALMTQPEFVLLDEPMAGVNPALVQSLLDHILDLRDEGMTVLFVEHDMHMVRHIADWVVVMAEGKVVAEGPPETVMQDQAVVDAYLGSHHDADLGDESFEDEQRLEELQAEVAAEDAQQEGRA